MFQKLQRITPSSVTHTHIHKYTHTLTNKHINITLSLRISLIEQNEDFLLSVYSIAELPHDRFCVFYQLHVLLAFQNRGHVCYFFLHMFIPEVLILDLVSLGIYKGGVTGYMLTIHAYKKKKKNTTTVEGHCFCIFFRYLYSKWHSTIVQVPGLL